MIYFLRCERDTVDTEMGWPIAAGWIKVGTTVRLSERLKQIAIKIGHMPTLLGVIDGGYAEEHALHERYDGFRRIGEWFIPDGSDLLCLIENEARPWNGKDDNPLGRMVRLDDDLVEKGKKVAALQGVSLAELFSNILRPVIDREFSKEVRKLAKEEGSKD